MAEKIVIRKDDVHAFVARCMSKAGANTDEANVMADVLVAADHRGHYSHGLNRLEMYVRDVQAGTTASGKTPTIVKETVATALVNGNNLLGPAVGKFCIDLAIAKAKEAGIGLVVANHSNHYGIAGWYSIRATDQGLLGMSMTNTSPLVVPTRAKQCAVGTNPITLSAPGKNGDSFVLDMATSAVAVGKVELQAVKGEKMPDGWACDKDGKVTNDPVEARKDGGLMPLGGVELTSGYKGYGLGMMVEVLCGILSGGAFGPFVRNWKSTSTEANLGQCFIAINPAAFADGFEDRLQTLMDHYRHMEPVDPNKPVLIAGDPERAHIAECTAAGGIPYHPNLITLMNRLADELGVEKMKPISH